LLAIARFPELKKHKPADQEMIAGKSDKVL
jgi:hypothetical protein